MREIDKKLTFSVDKYIMYINIAMCCSLEARTYHMYLLLQKNVQMTDIGLYHLFARVDGRRRMSNPLLATYENEIIYSRNWYTLTES